MIPKPVVTFLYLLDLIQYTFSFLLYLINLNPSFVTEPTPWENDELLFFSLDISMDSAAESLKRKLPVVDYKSFLKKKGRSPSTDHCAICLQSMEATDPVRELKNCCHAFHVDCMDRWLDLGRLSCPLCRTEVVPALAGRRGPLAVLKVLLVGDTYNCNL